MYIQSTYLNTVIYYYFITSQSMMSLTRYYADKPNNNVICNIPPLTTKLPL